MVACVPRMVENHRNLLVRALSFLGGLFLFTFLFFFNIIWWMGKKKVPVVCQLNPMRPFQQQLTMLPTRPGPERCGAVEIAMRR